MAVTQTPNPAPSQAWRPPQWGSTNTPMVLVTVPASSSVSNVTQTDSDANSATGGGTFMFKKSVTAAVSYVFDAVLAADHDQSLTKTQHPIQTGAAVSSHAYLNPAHLILSVLMSDVVQQYVPTNQTTAPYIQKWTGFKSKSVSAYQQLLTLQAQRVPLTVTTRLRTYTNMIITRVAPREDDKTITGARFRVEFEQIFVANTQVVPVSARPNDTQATGLGAVSTQTPSSTVQSQFGVPPTASTNTLPGTVPTATPASTVVDIPGAGAYASPPQQFSA